MSIERMKQIRDAYPEVDLPDLPDLSPLGPVMEVGILICQAIERFAERAPRR